MKHPDHCIDASIITNGTDYCSEFDVKVEGIVMSCKILADPGVKWDVGCEIDKLGPAIATRGVYYIYEIYLEGTAIGEPLAVNRRLETDLARLIPDSYGDSGVEVFFFLPPKIYGNYAESFRPRNWLIELKVYQYDGYFNEPKTPLSSSRAIFYRREVSLPKLEEFRDLETERLIIHYKWQYYCLELASFLGVRLSTRHEEKNKKSSTKKTGGEGCLGETSHLASGPSTPMDIVPSDPPRGGSEPLPEYWWGPRPKSPPAWEQRGRDCVRMGDSNKYVHRDRSPLGGRVFDVDGLLEQLRKPAALQKGPIRGERPMLPVRKPLMPSLPSGWELRYTGAYKVYYVNHKEKYTTWRHPLAESLNMPEKGETPVSDKTPQEWSNEDKQAHPNRARLQELDKSGGVLLEQRGRIEASVQRLMFSDEGPGIWREKNIEHWFPGAEGSEPIIEHIYAYIIDPTYLERAIQLRDSIIAEMICWKHDLEELENSVLLTTIGPMTSGTSSTIESGYDERRKKRTSEELEEDHMDVDDETAQDSNYTSQVDYREDYGPEVPITRDGDIDPDWHRDKIARITEPYDQERSTGADQYNSDLSGIPDGYAECFLPGQVDVAGDWFGSDVREEDDQYQLEKAIQESLRQYVIDMERQASEAVADSSECSNSESRSQSEHDLDDYSNPSFEEVSQRNLLGSDDREDYDVETNRVREQSLLRQMSKLFAGDDLRSASNNEYDMGDPSSDNELETGTLETSTLVGVTELVNTSSNSQSNNWEDFDNPLLEQVSSPSVPDDWEDHDTENDNELYAPPPWYWLSRIDQMAVSSPQPVLVLRGGHQSATLENSTISSKVLGGEKREDDCLRAAPSEIGLTETQVKQPDIDQTGSLPTKSGPIGALEGYLVKSGAGPPDSEPAGEPDTIIHVIGSKKPRRKGKKKSGTGSKKPVTSGITLKGNYNLRKRHPKP